MASIWTLQLHPVSVPHRPLSYQFELRSESGVSCSYQIWNVKDRCRDFVIRASSNLAPSNEDNQIKDELFLAKSKSKDVAVAKHPISRLQETVISLPPVSFLAKSLPQAKNLPRVNFSVGLCIATTLLVVSVRIYLARKASYKHPGSVADLVRRGQLKSDRRGISKPLKYEDPFNNPLVKVDKNNATVKMCGKVYRLAPVTLTREEQNTHQRRRSRAYQWKRPTIFLKEGDSIPPDVDPDTVRWIPANHPFATTASDISEDLAQNNVYQKHGVPFRIQAEHEALQKKLEAFQSDQKFNHLVIDPGTARNFERPFKSNLKSDDQLAEQSSSNGEAGSSKPPQSEGELVSNE